MRRRLPRFQGDNLDHNLALVRRLEALAATRRCTPAQLALAWLLAKGNDIVPIPGTKRVKYVEENVGAAAIELTEAEVDGARGDLHARRRLRAIAITKRWGGWSTGPPEGPPLRDPGSRIRRDQGSGIRIRDQINHGKREDIDRVMPDDR